MSGMRRGPVPAKGLALAVPVALLRGRVMYFRSSLDNFGDIFVAGNGLAAIICIRYAANLSLTVDEVAQEYRRTIALLGIIPGGGPVSRELWLYNRYGILRFFRAGDTGLVEIDNRGMPLGPACTKQRAPAPPGPLPKKPAPKKPEKEKSGGTPAHGEPPGIIPAGPATGPGPEIGEAVPTGPSGPVPGEIPGPEEHAPDVEGSPRTRPLPPVQDPVPVPGTSGEMI